MAVERVYPQVMITDIGLYDERMLEDLRRGINYLPKGESRPASVISVDYDTNKVETNTRPSTSSPLYRPPEESQVDL